MDPEIKHLITILSFSWLFLKFSMKLRSDIDLPRNRIVFQMDKDFVVEDQEIREYMLKKDIGERAWALIGLILIYSAIMFVFAVTTTVTMGDCEKELCKAINLLALGGLAGGIFIPFLWVQDYKFLKGQIKSAAHTGAGS